MNAQLKAVLDFANYQQTFSIHKKILKERTAAKLMYGFSGGLFAIDRNLLTFVDILATEKENPFSAYVAFPNPATDFLNVGLPQAMVGTYAIEIIDKYKRKSKKLVLPQLSNVNFNKGIKELIEVAGWTYNYSKIRFKQGKAIEINNPKGNSYRFCDHITAHTMRRTAITTMLRLHVPEQIVRKISGHSANSAEFFKYVEFAQSYLDEHTEVYFEKMKNMRKE